MRGSKKIKKVAILGYPIRHSLSPKIHNYWLKKNNIFGTYIPIETPLKKLKESITRLCKQDYVGANLTIPLKENAINFLDKTDTTVDSIKAVNTLIFHDKKFIEGKNTDVLGFKTSLKESMKTTTKEKAIIIGNGGAARAILYSLVTLKYKQIVICARKRTKSEQLRKDMEKLQFKNSKTVIILKNIENIEEETEETNLLVNTTPLGMKGFPDIFFSFDKLNKNALVFDVVYNPLETNLLKQTRKRGNKTINGLRMLLYQAQGGFKAWFHKKPKITKELENFLKEEIK